MALAFVATPIYAVRTRRAQFLIGSHAQQHAVTIPGIYHHYGPAVDAGYLNLAPYNAQTFVTATQANNMPQALWERKMIEAQDYIRQPRQLMGLPRWFVHHIDTILPSSFWARLLIFILLIIGNYLMFLMAKGLYYYFDCDDYRQNATPFCISTTKLRCMLDCISTNSLYTLSTLSLVL